MTEPTRTSTGVAYLTYDASLNTDASMIIQQKLDLSGNTIAQTFCENAFNLAAERDISGSLLTDNDITDFTNNLVYLGSNDMNVQKTFLSANENSSKTQLLSINAYKMTLGKNIQIPLVSKLKLPPTVSNIYEYSEYSTKYPRPSYDYPANTDYAIQRFEIGNVYEIKNIPYATSTQLSVRGNDIDGFSCIDNFSYTARYAGLISESDVSKNLFIQILGPTTEWPTGETKNGVTSTTLSNSSSVYQEHLTSGYKFIDRYVIPEVYEVSFYIRSFNNSPRLSALLFYDSSHNVIPTVEIEKTPNNIDGTPNILSFPTSSPTLSFENLIDYYIPTQWRPSKGSGAPRTESVDGTLKIKLWRQPVYYKYVTSYYDVNNDSVFQYSKSNITSWTMYDHTLNKISNEYFFNNENYIQNIPPNHFFPVDSSGNSSGYYDFNDNDFIDDIYDSTIKTNIQNFDSSFLVGRVYQLIFLTGYYDATLARGNNVSGFGPNDSFGSAASKAGIEATGTADSVYIKVFSNITTEYDGISTTYSKGFKFITNASFKSIDYSEIIRLNNELGGTYYGSSLSLFNSKFIRYFLIPNSIYRIDNLIGDANEVHPDFTTIQYVFGNDSDGYSMSSFLSTASVHSGVLRDGETGSVYIKLSDVMNDNFSGTTKNGVTSNSSPTSNFSFKIYSNTFVNGPEPEPEPEPEPVPEPEPEPEPQPEPEQPPPIISNSYEYRNLTAQRNVDDNYDYPEDPDIIFKKYEIGKFYEIRNVLWENYTGHIFGNSIDGFRNQDYFPRTAKYAGLITSSDVSKNLYIEVLGPVTEWPAGPTQNGVESKAGTVASQISHGYRFISYYDIPYQVHEVSFYIRSNYRGVRLSALLFYDSSHNIVPTVDIQLMPNNIDGTTNKLQISSTNSSIAKLIDYDKGNGMETTGYSEQGNGTLKLKLWGQPSYYRFVTKSNNSNKYMPTCWTMYDHTSNKISNEYFYDNIYYSGTIPNKHFYPVDSSGNSSGYYDFNDNEFIDDIYDSSSKTKIQDSDLSFLVGRVYQLINLTGNSDSTLASGNNTSGFGSNDLFGSAVTKAGIIGAGSVGTAYIKVFSNIITGSTTNSKGFKFITNASFKSFDSSKLDGDTLRDQAPISFNSGANQCMINNSIYRIDNVTGNAPTDPDDYDVRGNNVDGYHLYETQISTAAVHSGVLANGESGSVYVKCFDVKLASFTGTTSNGVTSVDDNDTSATDGYSFKIYSLPSMLGATLFNKVRIFRSDATVGGGYNLDIAEFQIWIDGTNIARNITPIASFVISTSGNNRLGIINDGYTQAQYAGSWYMATNADSRALFTNGTYNLTDNPIEVIFSMSEKNINDLQSIVVYGRNHGSSYYGLQGASVQLLYNDNVIYTQEINNKNGTSNQLVWRFDGPDISNVSTFADSASADYIIGSNYDKLYTYTINT